MSIYINRKRERVTLKTKRTMYVFEMLFGKYPIHLYYGAIKSAQGIEYVKKSKSFSATYSDERIYPDTVASELPLFGSGDYRATALKLRSMETGSDVTYFIYKSMRKFKGRFSPDGLPCADADENTETLELTLTDEVTGAILRLYYTVFPESDVISRYFVLENRGKADLRIEKAMPLALDIDGDERDMISFYGEWAHERHIQRQPLMRGNQRVFSRRGSSSHHFSPFMMVTDKKATEERGEAYAFNFVWSGNWLGEVETDQTHNTRVLLGLGDECFNYLLKSGESFASPEAVMTYSAGGIGRASRNMHRFVRAHILPRDKFPCRPVVLNSWEAFFFNIDAERMESFGAEAAKCGMDMVVMDDGWFGKRVNDKAGLGDWYANPDRFPDGLAPFVRRVKKNGIKFGIWIEPEMVNPDSELFRARPEYVIAAPGRRQLESRSQYVLDMANPEVLDYLKCAFAKTLGNADIDYIKWDMNRNMTEVYSPSLPPERQGEAAYRYMLGVYDLFRWFNENFPNVMIENCSGGGGRYDLGMMKYSTQIWASDNTSPIHRTFIQHGSTFGFPTSVMSCHVGNHKGCIEDARKLDYRFRVAMNGPLGYEFDVLSASERVKNTISEQIKEYRTYEELILRGEFFRLLDPSACGRYAYYFADKETNASELLLSFLQNEGDEREREFRLKLSAADASADYVDTISGERFSGAELKRGITAKSDKDGEYARMWHFVRK